MKIYTKTGDKGETGLFGGERVSKNNLRLNAYGSIDELNSFLGLAIIEVISVEIKDVLVDLQNKLFVLGADLATPETEKNAKLKITRLPDLYISESPYKVIAVYGLLEYMATPALQQSLFPVFQNTSALVRELPRYYSF
ncbi:MAG: ATP:cob(I)alamin adenosyltransferase [Ignavibacterium sp.]|nr:ATP:cob(I)alamin adenosyltransferase [Ignavibacterium sp.]